MRILFLKEIKSSTNATSDTQVQAKEEEVKRKQREVEAAMKILDRLID